MAEHVSIHDAKTHFSRLADRAHHSEEIVIAKSGVPWARLVTLAQATQRQPGLLSGDLGTAWLEPLPAEELEAWRP